MSNSGFVRERFDPERRAASSAGERDLFDGDRRHAASTVPRGRSRADDDRTPSVDPDLWLDHVRLARRNDPEALGRLVAEYERYARSLALRLHRRHEPSEDLQQIALEALVVALRRFDPDRGIPFPAFATPTILGAIRRHFRDHGWLVRVPRPIHEFAAAERAAVDRLTARLGRVPTTDELAEALDLSIDDLLHAQDAVHARDPRSLDAEAGDGGSLGDRLGREDAALVLAEDRLAAMAAIELLEPRDQRLLRLYYFEEWTQSRIAADLGISQMQVSRLLDSALRRLRSLASAGS